MNTLKKIGIGALGAGSLLVSNAVDAYAQNKKFLKEQDHGASIEIDKGKSKYSLEEKIIYGDRFYFHNLGKKSEGGLGLAALDVHNSQIILNSSTKEVEEIKADKQYIYKKVKLADGNFANEIKIKGVKISGWCDEQIKKKANVPKGTDSYITQTDVQSLLPEIEILELANGKKFYYPKVLASELNKVGETNHYLIPLETAKIGLNQADKSITIYGEIYKGYLENGVVVIRADQTSSGQASEVGRDSTIVSPEQEQADSTKPKIKMPSSAYLIIGGEGTPNFIGGDFGIQKGPLALVANYDRMLENENVSEITTQPSPLTGRYGYGKVDNTNIDIKGLALELHPFHRKGFSPFIGGGINNWNYTTKSLEQIRAPNGDVLEENSNSKNNSENSWKAYGGVNFGRKSKLGLIGGYDSKAKYFAGVRYSVRLGGKKWKH